MNNAPVALTAPADDDPPRWDPLSAPFLSRQCRAGRHRQCVGGLMYYPDGWDGVQIDIACSCDQPGCPCWTAKR